MFPRRHTRFLSRFEEENCNLAQVEIDEMLCLVCYVAAEIPAHNAVPSGVVFLVKFLEEQAEEMGESTACHKYNGVGFCKN